MRMHEVTAGWERKWSSTLLISGCVGSFLHKGQLGLRRQNHKSPFRQNLTIVFVSLPFDGHKFGNYSKIVAAQLTSAIQFFNGSSSDAARLHRWPRAERPKASICPSTWDSPSVWRVVYMRRREFLVRGLKLFVPHIQAWNCLFRGDVLVFKY